MKIHKKYLLFLPLLLFAALLAGQSPRTGDYWWRLHFGQETLQGNLNKTNESSFSGQKEWIDHAWGYGVLIAAVDSFGGFRGVKAFHSVLFFLLVLVAFSGYRGLQTLAGFLGILLVFGHYALRPYLIGDIFLMGMVLTIVSWKSGKIKLKKTGWWKFGLLVYFYFAVWSNLHGSVMAGFFLGAFLLFPFASFFPQLATGFFQTDKAKTSVSWKDWLLACFVAGIGILTNPWFYRLPVFLVKYIFGFYRFLPGIDEWQAPDKFLLILLIFYLIYLFYRGLKNNIPKYYFLVLIILSYFGGSSQRNLPILIIVGNLLTAKNPLAFLGYLKKSWNEQNKIPLVFAGLLIVAVALVSSFQKPEYNFEFQKTVYPEKLFVQGQNHLKDKGIKRIFVPHRWGGALLYHFDGKYLNFIDSRNDCFSREVWDDYSTIIYTRSKWFETWNKYDPQAAFLPNSTPLSKKLQAKNWQINVKNKQGILLLKPHISKKE